MWSWYVVSVFGEFFISDFVCIEFYFDAQLARMVGARAGVPRGVPGLRVPLDILHLDVPHGRMFRWILVEENSKTYFVIYF